MTATRRAQADIREAAAAEKLRQEEMQRAREIKARDRERELTAQEFQRKTEDFAGHWPRRTG